MRNIFRTGRPTNLKLRPRSMKTRVTYKRYDLQVRKVTRCVWAWQFMADKSRTRSPGQKNTKLVGRLHTPCTYNKANWFQVQMAKVKVTVTRPINAEIKSVSYLQNGKAYEPQSWYTDGAGRPASPTSAVPFKVARSRDVSDRCWPIRRERNVLETPKFVGRFPPRWQ